MKRLLFVTFYCFILRTGFCQQQTLEQLTRKYGIPGLQLVCIKGDQKENFNIGTISKTSNQAVTSKTIFEAASLSKCVFAYAVLRLYDRGVLSLDTPLLKYIGSYERFTSDPRYARITARMVLRHTTGLPNWGDDKSVQIIFTPDSTFSYSGEGFQYLQHTIEKLTGKSLNLIAKEEVFDPLGMTNSSYKWTNRFDSLAAFGNSQNAINEHSTERAASSLLTSADDYSVFLSALLHGTGLKPETYKMMFEKQSAGYWFNHRTTEASQHIWWGLGMGLQENETGKWAWQWGDNGDFKGFCIINPEKKEALIYLTFSRWGLHITSDILNTFFGNQTWWPTTWLDYQFYEKNNMNIFWDALEKQGYNHATTIAADLKEKNSSFKLPESDVKDLANILLGKNQKEEAIDIFKFNIDANPRSADAYQSLAEGYEEIGQKDQALENYKKALALQPDDDYLKERIKKLSKD